MTRCIPCGSTIRRSCPQNWNGLASGLGRCDLMATSRCRGATPPSSRTSRHEAARKRWRKSSINTRMPELPEVETIKEDLGELVVGSELERAEVLAPSLVEQPPTEDFASRLEGVRITGTRRRAKHLIIEFDAGYLQRVIGSRRAQIKPLLLDQKVVSGIGNIYADEILYDARLHPRRKANTLSEDEWEALHAAIRSNLAAGVEHRGTKVRLYKDVLDRPGEYQNYLRVFEKHGQPCPGCEGEVVREKVSGRPSHFCPACQQEDGSESEGQLEL